MNDFSQVLEVFFEDLMTRLGSMIDIVSDQGSLYGFLSYIWFLCIPSEIATTFITVVLIIFVFGMIRHSKG